MHYRFLVHVHFAVKSEVELTVDNYEKGCIENLVCVSSLIIVLRVYKCTGLRWGFMKWALRPLIKKTLRNNLSSTKHILFKFNTWWNNILVSESCFFGIIKHLVYAVEIGTLWQRTPLKMLTIYISTGFFLQHFNL